MTQRLLAPLLAAALLSACGGGGSDSGDSGQVQTVAQGYAADATTMTVLSATQMDSAADVFEAALGAAATAGGGRMQPQAAQPRLVPAPWAGSLSCAGGGTVSWSITGGTAQQQLNGQLDAGESYQVQFSGCGVGGSDLVLDGGLRLDVTAVGSSNTDITLTAEALRGTTAQGSTTLTGSKRRQRSVVALQGGGRQVTAQLTSSGDLALVSNISGRSASYTLRALNWTIVRSFDANGVLTQRSHQGSLDLAVASPRRPSATLQISTQGTLTLGSDGLAAAGSFQVVTSDQRILCSYGSNSITLQLDIGNDGSIDRSWTLTRPVYNGEAG